MVQGPLRSARRQRESSALLGIADSLPQDKKIFQPRLSGGAFFRRKTGGERFLPCRIDALIRIAICFCRLCCINKIYFFDKFNKKNRFYKLQIQMYMDWLVIFIFYPQKETQMFLKKFCLLFAASLSLSGISAFAQSGGRLMDLPPAFKMKLDANQAKLNALEQKVDGMLGRKSIRLADESIEKEMYAYAQEMKAAFDEAQREAEAAGKSKGQRGNTVLLEKFEMMAKSHEVRTNSLAKKFDLIETGVKKGQIVLEKPVLMRLSPAEKDDFRKSLAPEGVRKMEGLHPDIFRPGTMMPGRTSMNLFDFDIEQVGCAVKSAGKVLADGFGDFFVRDAEAACIAPCVPPCAAQNWSACSVCIANVQPQCMPIWNNFVACWNGSCACKPWKPWCCAKKAWCLARFIALLA